jgi:hypothetical protein
VISPRLPVTSLDVLAADPGQAARLAADAYLDRRHHGLFWFEHLGLIRAEGEMVVVAPGVCAVLLALAGRAPP